jgi:uncharacterized Zn finger protein
MSYIDNMEIPLECRRCGRKSLHRIGKLRRSEETVCPSCGELGRITAEELRKRIRLIERMMENYEE